MIDFFKYNWGELITVIMALASLIVSVVALIKAGKKDKYKLTLEAYSKLQDSLRVLYKYRKSEIEDICRNRTSGEYKDLSYHVANVELFAVAVKEKIYDFDVVYKLAHGYLDQSLRGKIEYVIDKKGPNSRTEYYAEIIWLFQQMEAESKKKK